MRKPATTLLFLSIASSCSHERASAKGQDTGSAVAKPQATVAVEPQFLTHQDTLDGAVWVVGSDTAARDMMVTRFAKPVVTGNIRPSLPSLRFICRNGVFDLNVVAMNDSFEIRSKVRYTLDSQPPRSASWRVGGGIYVAPDEPEAFVQELIGHDSLLFERLVPGGSIGGKFALEGLADRVRELRAKCPGLNQLKL